MSTKRIPERTSIPENHKWNLTPLFSTDDDWTELQNTIEQEIEIYSRFKGHLHESAIILSECIEFHLSILRRLDRIYTYAQLRSDQDKSDQFYLGLVQRATNLVTRASEFASFMTPEIQSLPDDLMRRYRDDVSLKPYLFFLDKILRNKPHTLGAAEEKLLAMSLEVTQAPFQIFSQLDNVDLNFGTLSDDKGLELELSHGNFITLLTSANRDVRRNAFYRYYAAYEAHKNTLAASLSFSVKKDLFYSRVRHFPSCRSASLFEDDIPEVVYENLIMIVREHLPSLFAYLEMKKQALDLKTFHFYDTYVPIIPDVTFNMPFEEAVEVGIKALEPLGAAYARDLKGGLRGGWVDRYENRGKRSGAYSSGCYDSPPYILMNYEEKSINSLYTLLHEAGHSMHSLYARKHQPYVDHEYSIFIAEVASTLNEILLSRHLLRHYDGNPRMQAYILNREIENIRATLFRQTMFAEFEINIHYIVEKNQPLTLADTLRVYRDLLQEYFGDALVIDPQLPLECLRIPHFYSAFYVYKYATGISAAIALAEKIIGEGEAARQSYLNFLKLGGSKFPLDALETAGVNMRSSEPVRSACRHFANLVDRFKTVIKKL